MTLDRVARGVAWGIACVALAAFVVDTAVSAAYGSLRSEETWAEHGWPLATLATVGSAVMGALIVSRYPRHVIGWLLCIAGVSAVSLPLEAYSIWVLDHDGPGSDTAGHVAGWVSVLIGAPLATPAVSLVYLLAPDGRLPSPRWRWAAMTSVLGLVLYTAGILTLDPATFDLSVDEDVAPVTAVLASSGILLIAAGLVATAVSVVLRLRRAQGERRRQLLWVAVSASFLAGGFVWLLVVQLVTGEETQSLLSAGPLFTAYLVFPVCIAVAVLRHRLFDIDLIVNRALVLGLATATVASGYVVLVVLIGGQLGDGTPGFWGSMLATAVVALAFQPLRRRVVRAADRIAFGASAAPYEALADFSRRLGDSPDPRTLLPAVAEASGSAVGARRALARLSPTADAPEHAATWPPGAPAGDLPVEFAVVAGGEQLGSITVEMPPGRALRPEDTRLLQDLADQAAIAFRNVRLTTELADRVDQLDRRAEALRASRRRLVVVGDEEKARFAATLRRRVLPHLDPLPDRLRGESTRVAAATPAKPALDLGDERAAAQAALDELRELVRGSGPSRLSERQPTRGR